MADLTVAFREFLRKHELELDADFLRAGAKLLTELLMEAEVSAQIGADRHERTSERLTYRNGYRERDWQTRLGEVPLRRRGMRSGTYFPSFLEPRRRAERALLHVIQAAYVEGVSTRKVDELVQALGLTGIDKSAVSRITAELDTAVGAFRERPLVGPYPYLWLDALYVKVRQNGRIVSMALVIAIGVRQSGEREILGLDLGASEEGAFWTSFLRGLVQRGLRQVQLVISDAHSGVQEAIRTVLAGASWQRCRVHWTRNILAHVPQKDKGLVAATVRLIFAQPDQAAAKRQAGEVAATLRKHWPAAAAVLEEGIDDVLAYMSFPPEHWTRLYSTNPLERLNREVRRRCDIVGVFPDREAVLRLAGAVLSEIDDEWQVERRYFSSDSMRKLGAAGDEPTDGGTAPRLAPVR
jgi:transposase-like protein